MKRKLLLLFFFVFLACGCTSLQKDSYQTILADAMNSRLSLQNVFRAGYKYYLPKGMRIFHHEGSNEIFGFQDTYYYMYVDRVSYYHRTKQEYKKNPNAYYSEALKKDNLFGYVEIKNTQNDKYFIEIMYNYAKIEVIVEKDRVNTSLAYAISILSSITYQDEVLSSLMGEDVLQANEVEHNIFESAETESGYLQIVEEYGQYSEKEDTVDPDFIR